MTTNTPTLSRNICTANLSEYVKNDDIDAIETCLSMITPDSMYVSLAVRDAILLSKIPILRLFLCAGVSATSSAPKDDNIKGPRYTFIYFAGLSGNRDIVELLVAHDAKINNKDTYNSDDTAIKGAVEGGHAELVEYLLENGADAKEIYKYTHESLFSYAARHDQTLVLESLLKHVTSLSNTTIKVLKKTHTDLVEKFLINQLDENGETKLIKAVKARNNDEVNNLLTNGADVNKTWRDGSPLFIAASQCFRETTQDSCPETIKIIQTLLDYGADANFSFNKFNIPGEDYTPLQIAGLTGSADAFALLLPVTDTTRFSTPVDPNNNQLSYPWYTEIMFQSFDSDEWIKILALLRSSGADLNQHNDRGDTILHLTMRANPYSTKLLDFLFASGVHPSIIISKGKDTGHSALHTLLEWHDRMNTDDFVKILDKFIDNGFDINFKGAGGETLLHVAVKQRRLPIIVCLLEKGADVNISNDANLRPNDVAPETMKLAIDNINKKTQRMDNNEKQAGLSSSDFMRLFHPIKEKREGGEVRHVFEPC